MAHIVKSTIRNFKKFQHLEIDDLGMVNFFIGDNGVGKTSVLESLLINETKLNETYYNLFSAAAQRLNLREEVQASLLLNKSPLVGLDILNDFYYHDKNLNEIAVKHMYKNNSLAKSFKIYTKKIEKLDKNEQDFYNNLFLPHAKAVVILSEGDDIVEMISNDLEHFEPAYYPFIPFHLGYASDLVQFYSTHIQKNRAINRVFIDSLSVIIPAIEDIVISSESDGVSRIVCWLQNIDRPIPLGMLGEGASRLFRILAEIIVCRGNILMIDEIDTGIHFSKFKEFLTTILKVANTNDVQIFATTHSLECLKYFNEALKGEELNFLSDEARIYSLIESPSGEIKSLGYRFDQFSYSLDNNLEIRGGNSKIRL